MEDIMGGSDGSEPFRGEVSWIHLRDVLRFPWLHCLSWILLAPPAAWPLSRSHCLGHHLPVGLLRLTKSSWSEHLVPPITSRLRHSTTLKGLPKNSQRVPNDAAQICVGIHFMWGNRWSMGNKNWEGTSQINSLSFLPSTDCSRDSVSK